MRFELAEHSITAIREGGDPKFYGVQFARGESRLLHQIKIVLNNNGFDLIKKRMWKDGHLVDDLPPSIPAYILGTDPGSKKQVQHVPGGGKAVSHDSNGRDLGWCY